MSAFLGHIHYWLYSKIRRVVEREQLIYEKASETCKTAAEELQAQVRQTYGEPLPDTDLSHLIDPTNIHGWLQRQINIAEVREAAFIKELIDMCDTAGKNAVEAAFAEHGAFCGTHAREQGNHDITKADGIYNALNDYFLNGMPCDQADMLIVNSPEKVVWEGKNCLQETNWSKAGIETKVMKDLYQKWLVNFIKAVNPNYVFSQTADILKGDPVNRCEIQRREV